MPLSVGSRLGPYEVVGPLGAGGMGEVYRARDTKLGRDVAFKVLPAAFAADGDRMARFEREAQVLATLDPNIAAIYGIEQGALVMELVDGEELKGPVPIDTALDYARQIATGLEAAHENGIIHRDLKPANIKITSEGVVKVLDFGLAKAAEQPSAVSGSPSMSPTMSLAMTQAGVILGTAAAVAPSVPARRRSWLPWSWAGVFTVACAIAALIGWQAIKRGLFLILALSTALPLGAQNQSPDSEALRWSLALGGRFRDLREPVVAAHAIGNLAVLMCPYDRTSASALFQESLNRLRFLTPESFRLPNQLLPAPSFTALWEVIATAAEKCDPDLRRYSDIERAQAKMRAEHQLATDTLKRGATLIESRPDRAAQLAEAAMGVSDPASLDISELTRFLSDLRERAPDLADEVLDAALEFLTSDSQKLHPVDAYSAAVQLLHESKDAAPDLIDELQQILRQLASLVGARADALNAEFQIGSADLERPAVLTASADAGPAIGRVFHAIRSRNFPAARALARGLSAGGALGQVTSIIDFAEAADAIERGDLTAALPLANVLQPGIKRSLLYSAMTAASRDRDRGLGTLQLAFKDAEPMAAEHKMIALSAAAHAVLQKDLDNGLVALKLLVEAANDAARRPRRAFFDPASAQRAFSGRAASGTDTSLILFNKRCLCEVVMAREGRLYFGLKISGASVFRLADVVRNAVGVDPLRLEAILLSLRDERQMAEALLALAQLRLPAAR